ncbi:hypothetical protein [Paenibacillus sp. F4]|uniref:hypothetical protein n=1 Tax=Paenibacillus sp. F4 TaxID=357385 RepID=UPI0026CACF9C
MISWWKAEFLSRASMVFEKGTSEADKMRKEYESKQERLEKLVDQLTVEVDWLNGSITHLPAIPSSLMNFGIIGMISPMPVNTGNRFSIRTHHIPPHNLRVAAPSVILSKKAPALRQMFLAFRIS